MTRGQTFYSSYSGRITLAALLMIPALRLRLISGESTALNRLVRSVHPTETTDPSLYLRPDELVCTVGSALVTLEDSACVARAVHTVGAAGICFGIGDVHAAVPDALVRECRQLGVSLLTIPYGTPFLAINEHLLQAKLRASERRRRAGQIVALISDGLADQTSLEPELAALRLADHSELTVSAWPAGSAASIADLCSDALVADTLSIVYVVTASVGAVHAAAEQLDLLCGYSGPVSAREVGRGIADARSAFALACARGVSCGPENVPTLIAMLEQQNRALLKPFIDKHVRPLLHPDVRDSPALVDTLRRFIANGSVQRTATESFLHPNTVRYRLARIHQLTKRNPLDAEEQVDLRIAMWAYDHPDR